MCADDSFHAVDSVEPRGDPERGISIPSSLSGRTCSIMDPKTSCFEAQLLGPAEGAPSKAFLKASLKGFCAEGLYCMGTRGFWWVRG